MLLKQHLLKFFGVLILIQFCEEVTGNDKGRSPVSTMMKSDKNRKPENPIRGRPCKKPRPTKPAKNKNGTATKRGDATEGGRFFPGPFGWDISKFPIHLRPEKPVEPCDDDSTWARGDSPDAERPTASHKDMYEVLEDARCKALLESIKNKPDSQRPKPGEKKYPEIWGWDVGLVLRTQEASPRRRMREHNKKYQIHRCRKRQNKNKSSSKTQRQWMAPDYAQVAQALTEGQGGEMGDNGGASGRRIAIDPGLTGPGPDLDPGFNRPGLTGPGPDLDPGFNRPGGGNRRPYAIPSTLPAESYSDGGTAHAGQYGITSLVDRIAPGIGKPPLRFLPWAEIFGYKPAMQGSPSTVIKRS